MHHVAHGMMGTVYVTPKYAKKIILLDDLAWTKELAITLQLKPYTIETIAASKHFEFIEEEGAKKLLLMMEPCHRSMSLFDCSNDKKLLQMLLDISHALMFLHSQNIVHRDIKEANILIKRGRFLLADFSHSCLNKLIKRNDTYIITEPYRPPEYYSNIRVKHNTDAIGQQIPVHSYMEGCHTYLDEKADVWSLGIIMLNIMLGDFWYHIKDLSTTHHMGHFIKYKFCAWLEKQVSNFSDQLLTSLLLSMLQSDPTQRISAKQVYQSVVHICQIRKIPIKMPADPQMTMIPPSVEFYGTKDPCEIADKICDPLIFLSGKQYCTNYTATLASILFILDNGYFRELNASVDEPINYDKDLFSNRAEYLEALPTLLSMSFLFLLESTVYDNYIAESYMTELVFDFLQTKIDEYNFLKDKTINYKYASRFKKLCYNYLIDIFMLCGSKLFAEKRIDFNHNYNELWAMFQFKTNEIKDKSSKLAKLLKQFRPTTHDDRTFGLPNWFD